MVINNSDSVGYPTLETTACDSRGILKLNQNLIINKGSLHELYRVDKGAPFATGLYAQVRRCKSLRPNTSQKVTNSSSSSPSSSTSSSSSQTQPYYAAKFSPRKRPGHSQNEDCVESLHEIALLSQLKNPYIISFKDAFILDDFIVTIMEFAPGGDLQSVIDADLVLLEKDASRYVYQLLEALKYLHSRHIAHLDIKPQNLLLMGEFPSCDIKLCDFEISRVIRPGLEVREILGTPDYVAPEILMYEPLSTFCDMWSVGILTYVLLTGFSPFGGDTDQETFRNIINEPIDFPEELFEDVSPAAIDFIEKLAVKNGRTRPSAQDMEMHQWVRSYAPPSAIIVISASVDVEESQPQQQNQNQAVAVARERESSIPPESPFLSHCGPKKRSPRKASAMSGCSTASASPAGRRQSARSILRACKSAYDLNKMGGKTKSREALIEKMRIATGEPSGGPWKLRKNLSKSREQLWESKIQLSKSCERINNFPGSSRWASVANFPSLDMNTMKSAISQESVISVMSTCTNIGNLQHQHQLADFEGLMDDAFPYSVSMPSTPPVPNFDLSHNNGYHESSPPIITGDFSGYPSLNNGGSTGNGLAGELTPYMTREQATNAAIEEAQKSVAELINTFGGRVSKKLDLKNKFEPILEVDGSEEQPMSLGDCSDNNSTSGVSSIIASSNLNGNGKNTDNGKLGSLENNKNSLSPTNNKMDTGQHLSEPPGSGNSSRRNSKTTQQITDEINKSSENRRRGGGGDHYNPPHMSSTRRGSMSPPKHPDGTTLKGILKKPKQQQQQLPHHQPSHQSEFPNNPTSTRRGSIPSNCFRLYEQHTISSSAKSPKRSILKNSNHQQSAKSPSGSSTTKGGSSDRSSSRSPENSNNNQNNKDISSSNGGNEGKNENNNISQSLTNSTTSGVTTSPPNSNNPAVQMRTNRPTSILLTSNAENKLERLGSPSSRRRPRPRSADISGIVIPTEKDRAFEREIKMERNSRHNQSKKRHEQPSNQQNNNIISMNNSNNASSGTNNLSNQLMISQPQQPSPESLVGGGGDNTEPAAVAIKVFPPDPIIIPKSSVLLLKGTGSSPESPTGVEESSPNDFKDYSTSKRNSTSSTSSASSTSTATLMTATNKQQGIIQRTTATTTHQDGIKSQWGVVCTGSVVRAKERFESVRSKLRRGSVPDF